MPTISVVMAGGEGTRLRPLTANRPKPMVPVVNKPILEHTVETLRDNGSSRQIFTLHYMPRAVIDHFGDGSKWGVRISYSLEDRALGTAGGVRKALEEYEGERVIVWSGDILTRFNIKEMIRFHQSRGALVTIAATRVPNPSEFGVMVPDEEYRVTRFIEKPTGAEAVSDLINCGVYVMEPEALSYIPRGSEYDFSRDLFPRLLEEGEAIYMWPISGYWADIGSPRQYLEAHLDILSGKIKEIEPPGKELERGVWAEDPSDVDGIEMEPPLMIGRGNRIERGASLGPFTVIGSGNTVRRGSRIERSVVWSGNLVGRDVEVKGSIICDRCELSEGVRMYEGSILADECRVGAHVMIRPEVKIWPAKYIANYSTVSSNIKWGIRWYSSLFTHDWIMGPLNVEITPELAGKLGLSIGSWLPKGSRVAVASDNSTQARMIKRALISGIMSSGTNVYNLGIAASPLLRDFITTHGIDAGVMFSSSITMPGNLCIKIMNRDGVEIDQEAQKKIDTMFFREEFRRPTYEEIGFLTYSQISLHSYVSKLLKRLEKSVRKDLRVVVSASMGATSSILPTILSQVGVDSVLLNMLDERPVSLKLDITQEIGKLSRLVTSLDADMGVVFDEEGGRIILIDEEGDVIGGERLIAIFSKHLIEEERGRIVLSSSLSPSLCDYISDIGGEIVKSRRGWGEVMRKTLGTGALLGGDDSGGIIIPRLNNCIDGIAAALYALVLASGERLSRFSSNIDLRYTSTRSIPILRERVGDVMSKIINETRGYVIDILGGIKIIEEDSWLIVMPHHKEQSLALHAEASSKEKADFILRSYEALIRASI